VAQSIGAAGLGPAAIPLFLVAAAATGLATYIIVGNINALPGIRSSGVKKAKYMVLLEEGMWNSVSFYAFDTEDQAWGFWNSVSSERNYLARVIFSPKCVELGSGGWNHWANQTIRRAHNGPVSKCGGRIVGGAFVPGNVIALHCVCRNRFIRMEGEAVNAGGGPMDFDKFPADWQWERFTVVDAGNGEFALHSGVFNRYVRLIGDRVDSQGGVKGKNELPREWNSERFTLVDAGDGLVALHSNSHNRFMRMDDHLSVNAKGGVRDCDSLPDCWGAERFRILNLTVAGK